MINILFRQSNRLLQGGTADDRLAEMAEAVAQFHTTGRKKTEKGQLKWKRREKMKEPYV